MTAGIFARIALRYLAGYLVLKGLLPQDIADMIAQDPELAALVGSGLMIAVEGFYAVAKKRGWTT
ncbi:hypothetical protein ASD54_12210 [Rhizobium sp. Root149]|uniref:hypothetical protein n=1 Tax=Rhizobium sp. Root149 TaxID=1736473 RepID=UPI00071515C0|nr:hypothetical protein [Rhizobium sp. Root149]KQZ49695.1 hypothetical protein ASD54_12210 [Rhizobium sp. Root149]